MNRIRNKIIIDKDDEGDGNIGSNDNSNDNGDNDDFEDQSTKTERRFRVLYCTKINFLL